MSFNYAREWHKDITEVNTMKAELFFSLIREMYEEEDLRNRIKKQSKRTYKNDKGKVITTIPIL